MLPESSGGIQEAGLDGLPWPDPAKEALLIFGCWFQAMLGLSSLLILEGGCLSMPDVGGTKMCPRRHLVGPWEGLGLDPAKGALLVFWASPGRAGNNCCWKAAWAVLGWAGPAFQGLLLAPPPSTAASLSLAWVTWPPAGPLTPQLDGWGWSADAAFLLLQRAAGWGRGRVWRLPRHPLLGFAGPLQPAGLRSPCCRLSLWHIVPGQA